MGDRSQLRLATRGGQKVDESDFEFVLEEMDDEQDPKIQVVNGRVLDNPKKTRSISIGQGQKKSVTICIHGKLVTLICALCEYEAPRVGSAR